MRSVKEIDFGMKKKLTSMPESTRKMKKSKIAMNDSTNKYHLVDAKGRAGFNENAIKQEPHNASVVKEEMEHEFVIPSTDGHEFDPLVMGGTTEEPNEILGVKMGPCSCSESQCTDHTVLQIKRLRQDEVLQTPEADTMSLPISCPDEVILCSSDEDEMISCPSKEVITCPSNEEVITCLSDDEVILCSSDEEEQIIQPYTPNDRAPVLNLMLNASGVKIETGPPAVAPIEPNTPDDVPYFWVGEELSNPVIPFTGQSGIQYKHSGAPDDYFRLILNYNFCRIFVEQANECGTEMAKGFRETRRRKSIPSIVSQWKPIAMDEFEIWIGILIHMGGIQCPSFTDYWRSSFFTQISSTMSRDRWIGIMQTLHFQKAEASKPPKPFFKIEPLIKCFNEQMKSMYSPERELFLEEPMVMVQSQLIPWSSLRDKKRGIKLHCLTNPEGLILRFLADKVDVSHEPNSCKVVRTLLEDFVGKGHSVFMDKCYSSVDLCHELLSCDTHSSGPLSPLRKNIPERIVESRLQPGHVVYAKSNHGVVLLKWRDENEEVLFVSSEFSPFLVQTSYKSDKELKPEAVAVFDKQVSAFGKPFQKLTEFGAVQKHTNNHVKISVHIIQMAVYNAYLLYKKMDSNRMDFAEFRRELVRKLLKNKSVFCAPVTKVAPVSASDTWHVLEPELLETEKGKKKVYLRCEQCRKNRKCKNVSGCCGQCPNRPGLCLGDCFVQWHLELGFSNVTVGGEGTKKVDPQNLCPKSVSKL